MTNRGWAVLGATAFLLAGCGGKAATEANGGAGSPSYVLPIDDDAPDYTPPGGNANSNAGGSRNSGTTESEGGDADGCTTTLEEVSNALGFACPSELCAATQLAADCGALPGAITSSSEASCDSDDFRFRTVGFEISQTRRKLCHYAADYSDSSAPAMLAGAEVWDDQPGFCNGAAKHATAGLQPNHCGYDPASSLCGGSPPNQSSGRDGKPRACFNFGSATCDVCCGATPPDCTGKPQNYPGYTCTPPPNPNGVYSYCSCDCEDEQFTCGC